MELPDEPIAVGKEARRRRLRFDDRLDVDTDISSVGVIVLLGRSLTLLGQAKGLFAAKFLLRLGLVWPALLLPWVGKIITDNVLLQRPFGETEIPYPPFMNPIITVIDGMPPMNIMLVFAGIYAVMLLVFGTRAGETRAELYEGPTRRPKPKTRSAEAAAKAADCRASPNAWSTSASPNGSPIPCERGCSNA